MIQRIQSVFLLVSLCFLVTMFFVPVAELFYDTGKILYFNLFGFYLSEAGTTAYISAQYSIIRAFGLLICTMNLLIIFMFKFRLYQIRLCIYNILMLAGLMGVMFYVLNNIQDVQSVSYRLPIVFPVVAIILHYLALRGIRKDEMMVKALNRLR